MNYNSFLRTKLVKAPISGFDLSPDEINLADIGLRMLTPREIRRLQRWVNNKQIFGSCPKFEDYL